MPTGVYPRPSLSDRFWSKVQKTDTCWLWTAATTRWGYGYILADGRLQHAHRVAWELENGPIPAGLEIDHLCRVRPCIRPDHLEPVTPAENRRREMAARPRVTSCRHGHPYTPQNTHVNRAGSRICRTCARSRRDAA